MSFGAVLLDCFADILILPVIGEVMVVNFEKVIGVQILNVEEHISNIIINYAQIFRDGSRKICRKNVKHLGGYYDCFHPKPIASAQCVGKVYCGVLRNDPRLLFLIKLRDGSVQLIQARQGTDDCMKLFNLA